MRAGRFQSDLLPPPSPAATSPTLTLLTNSFRAMVYALSACVTRRSVTATACCDLGAALVALVILADGNDKIEQVLPGGASMAFMRPGQTVFECAQQRFSQAAPLRPGRLCRPSATRRFDHGLQQQGCRSRRLPCWQAPYLPRPTRWRQDTPAPGAHSHRTFLARSTSSLLPSQSTPSRARMASSTSSSVDMATKPKPLLLPATGSRAQHRRSSQWAQAAARMGGLAPDTHTAEAASKPALYGLPSGRPGPPCACGCLPRTSSQCTSRATGRTHAPQSSRPAARHRRPPVCGSRTMRTSSTVP